MAMRMERLCRAFEEGSLQRLHTLQCYCSVTTYIQLTLQGFRGLSGESETQSHELNVS